MDLAFHCHEYDHNPAQCDTSLTNSNNAPTDRSHPRSHTDFWAAFGNPCAAEYAVNPKITDESKATRLAKILGSIQFESVAEGKPITSQRALALT
jgi:hypothetical protein